MQLLLNSSLVLCGDCHSLCLSLGKTYYFSEGREEEKVLLSKYETAFNDQLFSTLALCSVCVLCRKIKHSVELQTLLVTNSISVQPQELMWLWQIRSLLLPPKNCSVLLV